MDEIKKNNLIKARNLYTIFRFIDNLNSINDGGKLVTNYCDIENIDEHESNSSDLEIKIRDEKFQVAVLVKRYLFCFNFIQNTRQVKKSATLAQNAQELTN